MPCWNSSCMCVFVYVSKHEHWRKSHRINTIEYIGQITFWVSSSVCALKHLSKINGSRIPVNQTSHSCVWWYNNDLLCITNLYSILVFQHTGKFSFWNLNANQFRNMYTMEYRKLIMNNFRTICIYIWSYLIFWTKNERNEMRTRMADTHNYHTMHCEIMRRGEWEREREEEQKNSDGSNLFEFTSVSKWVKFYVEIKEDNIRIIISPNYLIRMLYFKLLTKKTKIQPIRIWTIIIIT